MSAHETPFADAELDAPATRTLGPFLAVWSGQLVSLVGTGMTEFALGLWTYERTGSVTAYAMVSLFAMLPFVLASPMAGALTDRRDRRRILIASDAASGVLSLLLAVTYAAGRLSAPLVWIVAGAAAAIASFRAAAYGASISTLAGEKQAGRANGLVQLATSIGQVASPALAGSLMATIGLGGICVVDVVTFAFAVATTLVVRRFPAPRASSSADAPQGGRTWLFGVHWLRARPGLFLLLGLFGVVNFFVAVVLVLEMPLVLSFASPATLGGVLAIGGAGMVAGGALASAWAGPRRRVPLILALQAAMGIAALAAAVRPSLWSVVVAMTGLYACVPVYLANALALWQLKVPEDVQGRVFAVRNVIATAAVPVAYALVGPFVERVLDPWLAGTQLGWATGPGRGPAAAVALAGALIALTSLAGFCVPRIRRLEEEVPDGCK